MIKTLLLSLLIVCSAAVCNAQTTYPVALDFRSIGTGVPSDEAVKLYVDSFKTKHAIKELAVAHIGPLGKEGEYVLAFPLTSFSKKQCADFVSGLKKLTSQKQSHGNINLVENYVVDPSKISSRAKVEEQSW